MVVIHKKHEETEEEKQQKAKEASLGIQDEFQAKGFELVSFAQTHKGSIIGVIGLFLLAGVLITAYFYRQKRQDEEASNALIEALAPLEDEQEQGALDKKEKNAEIIEKLKNITTQYKGSKVAVIAEMYVSHLSIAEGQTKEGVEYYQKAVDRLSQKDNLYPIALIGLGYAFDGNSQPKESLETFEKVINLKKGLAEDVALWEAARLLNDNKEYEKAKTYLTRLLEEYPTSSFKKSAESLKGTIQ